MASRATGVDHVVKSIRLEFPQMRSRAHTSLSRLAAAGIAVLLAFAGVAPVAGWANGHGRNGDSHCLFGKEISPAAARIMFSQPGRLVTVSPEGLARIWKLRS